jgi:hypothetical protein
MASISRSGKRRSPRAPNLEELAEKVQELNDELRGADFRWPAGVEPNHVIVAKIIREGVPGPGANRNKARNSKEDEFVWCAAASSWSRGKIAACLGRTAQAVRLILCRLRTAQRAAERAARQSTGTMENGPSQSASAPSISDSPQGSSQVLVVGQTAESGRLPEPSSSSPVAQSSASFMTSRRMPQPSSTPPSAGPSWSAVQQPNGLVLFESKGQTTLERQTVNARTDPVCLGSSNLLQRDRSGMNVLAEAAAILEVMGIA